MGIGPFRRPSGSRYDAGASVTYNSTYNSIISPNPDPMKYKFVKVIEIGKFIIAKIKYEGCTNFEGNKILVFKDVPLVRLINQGVIDPHFSDSKKYVHPFARFTPTDEGWKAAEELCKVLSTE
jgi:hypothetical protein